MRYQDFCHNVEAQFYDPHVAQQNMATVKSYSNYTEEEKKLLGNILAYLSKEIGTRRIMLKPCFQDFDSINTNHVTFEQFTRALTKLGLNLPDYCFKILARNYMDKNNTVEVNYVAFNEEVDDYYRRAPRYDIEAASTLPKPNFTDFV